MSQIIVLNKSLGGFGLSEEGVYALALFGSPDAKIAIQEHDFEIQMSDPFSDEIEYNDADFTLCGIFYEQAKRSDPFLIAAIEKYGSESLNGMFSELRLIELPDDFNDWYISNCEGFETAHEQHRFF